MKTNIRSLIQNLFKPNTQDVEELPENKTAVKETVVEAVDETPVELIKDDVVPPAGTGFHAPVYPLHPDPFPMHRPVKLDNDDESQRINLQELGIDLCVKLEGSSSGLNSSLDRVRVNYIAEVSSDEAESRYELDKQLFLIKKQIIKYNYEIKLIQDDLIPEKKQELQKMETQIKEHQVLYAGTQMPEQMIYEDEVQTTMHLAIARGNELIRRFRARLKELAGAIEQEKLSADSIQMRLDGLSHFDHNVLLHKLNLFFLGWLSGMNGLNASKENVQECHDIFNTFTQNNVLQQRVNNFIN